MTIRYHGPIWWLAYFMSAPKDRPEAGSTTNICTLFWRCVLSVLLSPCFLLAFIAMGVILVVIGGPIWLGKKALVLVGGRRLARTEAYQVTRTYLAAKKSKVCPTVEIRAA